MSRHVVIINGHPDPRPARFCAALCDAYESGAQDAGWVTQRINLGELELGAITAHAREPPQARIVEALVDDIRRTPILFVAFPLWANEPPPAVQALFQRFPHLPDGASRPIVHLAVTMELPACLYQGANRKAPKEVARAVSITLPGMTMKSLTLIGSVNAISDHQRHHWIDVIRNHGLQAA